MILRESLLFYMGFGLLLIIIAIPLYLRMIKPNSFYGLRVPATFKDEEVWYEANAYSGRDIIIMGIVQMLFAVLLYLVPSISKTIYTLINTSVVLIGTVVITALGWRRANALLKNKV
jgi:uncharacterized membrane protein